jgi:Tfp pilus assembly protein PilF
VQAFEEQRHRAERQAAMDRWSQGDICGCESRLRAILARRPSDIEAHVRLAELAWSMNNASEAEAEYLAALGLAPDRADVEHALALVLEATGRTADASPHFIRAAQLDPRNDLYRL